MANISIKDVPPAWAESLRQRAARNHRSLQGELMALIESAVHEPAAVIGSPPSAPRVQEGSSHAARRGGKTIEQIAEAGRILFPEPVRGGPLAVDIIREERDAR